MIKFMNRLLFKQKNRPRIRSYFLCANKNKLVKLLLVLLRMRNLLSYQNFIISTDNRIDSKLRTFYLYKIPLMKNVKHQIKKTCAAWDLNPRPKVGFWRSLGCEGHTFLATWPLHLTTAHRKMRHKLWCIAGGVPWGMGCARMPHFHK